MNSPVSKDVEQALVQTTLEHLAPDSRDRWDACRSSHRFMAFTNKELVIYKLFMNQVQVVTTLFCTEVSLSSRGGMTSTWYDKEAKKPVQISSRPLEVANSIFLWHTFESDVRYALHKGLFSTRFSMLYKAPHHPRVRHENTLYMVERAIFDAGVTNVPL